MLRRNIDNSLSIFGRLAPIEIIRVRDIREHTMDLHTKHTFKQQENNRMNSDTLQGKWKQLRGNIKATFGKLTDDDLMQADGNAEKLLGALQARYGYTKAQAQTLWDKFTQKHADKVEDAKTDLNAAARR